MWSYHEFDDIDGGEIGTQSRDSKIETAREELFGFFLALKWEIWVDTSATMHRDSPTSHFPLSRFSLSLRSALLSCAYVWIMRLQ